MSAEEQRLAESRDSTIPWKKWGPYLSERQWGTVREDYSQDGNAWNYFPHDHARSRAYRWGEDGLAGFSDDKQKLCFSLALWNGADAILKERLFGLTNGEGNHGEDVKEYYFYLDSTPTHSYMKYLYKYPQQPYPYEDLVLTNRDRTRDELEYELLDTGVFDNDEYFDVFVEYAKASAEDVLIRITVHNRGSEPAPLHVLPTLLFRNTWSWYNGTKPLLQRTENSSATSISIEHSDLGSYQLHCEGQVPLLFTENETNNKRIFATRNRSPYVKDGINNYIVHGRDEAINPAGTGTKAAAHYQRVVPAGEAKVIKLRLKREESDSNSDHFGIDFDQVFAARKMEADEFYENISPPTLSKDEALVMRQALAGMLWSKQYYHFDLDIWLEEHGCHPTASRRSHSMRNKEWFHMLNDDIISMPDKWEYPWYAAWDLAFHTVALAMVDLDFAKQQIELMLREMYLHPNGQIPAYEWNFGDVNPPVHAWATCYIYYLEKERQGKGDITFLKLAFQKLLLNFTWWVNRKDPSGKNVFEGGFLGLDNIGVFDRSAPLPTGGFLEQADGTAWMALFSQNMLELALELAEHDPMYEDMALKFIEHFMWIASAMDRIGDNQDEMWDERDGFFYDLLRLPDGSAQRLKVRSIVGLLPLCATTIFPHGVDQKYPKLMERAKRFMERHRETVANIAPPDCPGCTGRAMLAILNEDKLRRILTRVLDPEEFWSEYGIRSLSRLHATDPYKVYVNNHEYRVDYLPAESNTGMFGGNSNWRGPVWFPVNILIARALMQFYMYYGESFRIECPTGSGNKMSLFEVSRELARNLTGIFVRNDEGVRPVYGGSAKFQNDPYWRDCILFYEYFHGDNGAGIGANHQTGWTGVAARVIQMMGYMSAEEALGATMSKPAARSYRRK